MLSAFIIPEELSAPGIGSLIGLPPVAKIVFFAWMVCFCPCPVSISTCLDGVSLARPLITSTSFPFKRLCTPPTSVAIILLLPALFGLSLIGEGYKKVKKSNTGWFSLITGLAFIVLVIAIYLYFSLFKHL